MRERNFAADTKSQASMLCNGFKLNLLRNEFLKSDAAMGDSGMVRSFAMILKFRLEHEPAELIQIADQFASICGCFLEQRERFDFTPGTLADDPVHVQTLHQTLLELQRRFRLLSHERAS